jgi:hypothetical protein
MSADITAGKLAKVYVKIREKRLALEKEVQALQEQQDMISAELLDLCKEQDVQTMKTEFGTISRRTTKNYWTSDWHEMYSFIKEHDAFALLQQRINNTNMKQFLEENPDLHPPGLNAEVKQTVTIVKR